MTQDKRHRADKREGLVQNDDVLFPSLNRYAYYTGGSLRQPKAASQRLRPICRAIFSDIVPY